MASKLRKSKQRDRILELLRSDHIHVTANWIYDQLRGEFPTLSLGNVYRNLNILVEQGEANRLGFGSTFDVYEAKRDHHVHFVCESCGRIEDIDVPGEQEAVFSRWVEEDRGHHVSAIEIRGLCASCRAQRSRDEDVSHDGRTEPVVSTRYDATVSKA